MQARAQARGLRTARKLPFQESSAMNLEGSVVIWGLGISSDIDMGRRRESAPDHRVPMRVPLAGIFVAAAVAPDATVGRLVSLHRMIAAGEGE